MDKQLLAVVAVFGTGAWVVWLIFNVVRAHMAARSRAVAQERLLLHVSSPELLKVFLSSEVGIRFLNMLEPDPKEIWRGIIRSLQTAATFAVLGIGTMLCFLIFREVQGLLAFGVGALILAAAFAVSAVVSIALHRRSGLLPERE